VVKNFSQKFGFVPSRAIIIILPMPKISFTQVPLSGCLGLDIDGTITSDSSFFAGITRKWLKAGRKLHVVSSRSPEARAETLFELKELGIALTTLYLLSNISTAQSLCPHTKLDWYQRHQWLKVDYALTHGITHFVDDESKVLDLFARFAPGVTAVAFDNRRQLLDLIADSGHKS
jgi:hypothetical protein